MLILLRNARYVVRNATNVEQDADVLIEGAHITAVGHGLADNLPPSPDVTILPAADHAVIPGLVNAHTHLYQSCLRGLHDDLPLEPWLQAVVFPYRRQANKVYPDEEMMVSNARAGCAEMLLNGTTAFIDLDSTTPAAWQAWQQLGIRGTVAFNLADVGVPAELAHPLHELERRALERAQIGLDLARHNPLLSVMLGPSTPLMCSRPLLEWIAETSRALGIGIHGHAAETAVELAKTREATGLTPIAWLHSAGVLSPKTSLAHCVHVTPDDIGLLAEHGAIPVHCPKSNMKLGSGTAPVPAMLKAGIPVAMANDGPASNDLQDMFEEMRMAALLHKVTGRPADLTAREAFRMATEHGARAALLNAGTLEAGRLADMTLVNLNRPHLSADHDIVPLLVYCGKGSDVDTVIVNGEIVVRDGHLTRADETEIVQQSRRLGRQRYRDMHSAQSVPG